jgi:peptidyl-tRNA hydrolase, PTH1 family
MWLIVGLGNPGDEHRGTRHNIGFEVADELAERAGIGFSERKFKARVGRGRIAGAECILMKPQGYMNLSGESVGPATGFYKLTTNDIVVIHDELDIEVARLKLKQGGGHGGHNGLRSLIEHLPDPNFLRVRVGIGRPPPRWDSADYVLSRPSKEDRQKLDDVVKEAADAVETILRDGIRRAMNVYNRAPAPDENEASRE